MDAEQRPCEHGCELLRRPRLCRMAEAGQHDIPHKRSACEYGKDDRQILRCGRHRSSPRRFASAMIPTSTSRTQTSVCVMTLRLTEQVLPEVQDDAAEERPGDEAPNE